MSEVPSPGSAGGVRRRVVLVTGLSGAGLSTALKALEDQGYEAVDNLPLRLVPLLVDTSDRDLAIGIDSRTRDYAAETLLRHRDALKGRPDLDVRLLFIDCDVEVLQRRFTETRRRHPLAVDRPVVDGIGRDRMLLFPLRDVADAVIDTSQLTPHDLRRRLALQFALSTTPGLFVFVISFSFRRGLPREADLVFDVRFLANPYWDPALRPMTGLDPAVQHAIAADPGYRPFIDGLTGLLGPLLPRYHREGKTYLTLAVGCTGGQHRSVHVAETLAAWLRGQGCTVGLHHRDLPRPEADIHDNRGDTR